MHGNQIPRAQIMFKNSMEISWLKHLKPERTLISMVIKEYTGLRGLSLPLWCGSLISGVLCRRWCPNSLSGCWHRERIDEAINPLEFKKTDL